MIEDFVEYVESLGGYTVSWIGKNVRIKLNHGISSMNLFFKDKNTVTFESYTIIIHDDYNFELVSNNGISLTDIHRNTDACETLFQIVFFLSNKYFDLVTSVSCIVDVKDRNLLGKELVKYAIFDDYDLMELGRLLGYRIEVLSRKDFSISYFDVPISIADDLLEKYFRYEDCHITPVSLINGFYVNCFDDNKTIEEILEYDKFKKLIKCCL